MKLEIIHKKINNMKTILHLIKRVINVLRGKDFFITIDYSINKEKFGSADASWVLASEFINNDSIIYSFGVGEDISFDLAMINKYGLTINAFDPTPRSIEWIKSQILPQNFKLHEYGISDYNGSATFYPPVNPNHISHSIIEKEQTKDKAIIVNMKTLQTIMTELGHSHIDVLKMDIEGAEYAVIEDIKKSNVRPTQVLIELHHRFAGIGINQSKKAIDSLKEMGYKIFSVSGNGEEFSFILKD